MSRQWYLSYEFYCMVFARLCKREKTKKAAVRKRLPEPALPKERATLCPRLAKEQKINASLKDWRTQQVVPAETRELPCAAVIAAILDSTVGSMSRCSSLYLNYTIIFQKNQAISQLFREFLRIQLQVFRKNHHYLPFFRPPALLPDHSGACPWSLPYLPVLPS